LDAAESKVVEDLQRVVLEELHHRIKTTLASVLAITSQSLLTAGSLEEGRKAIEFRLLALGRVHDLLLQAKWTSAKLSTILIGAIEPFDTHNISRFRIQSTNISVSAAAVLPLAMVLNELCTNALKYGALSNDTGQIDITATIDAAGENFHLQWKEKHGPAVAPPTRKSFGTRLIERSFIRQLRGEATLTFEPSGVVCNLNIPVAVLKPHI
jgi:two-component sensor histidine kinase